MPTWLASPPAVLRLAATVAAAAALMGLAQPASATPPPDDPNQSVADSARRQARSTAEWLARGVDGWFGDRPFSDGGKVSEGELSLRLLKRQDDSLQHDLRFKARFRLPNLEENAYAFIGRDDQREVVSDKPNAFTNEQLLLKGNAEDRSFFAGVGVRLRNSVDLRLGLRGGFKPYAQARVGRQFWLSSRDLLELRETLFITSGDKLGSTTALSYEHAVSSTLAWRWLNAATITQRSRKFEWSSSLGAYQSFGTQRLLSLEGLVRGVQSSGVPVADYGLQLKWEQPVHRDWLIGEAIVGHFWPRPDALSERGRAWAVGASLRMKF
ncbi:hypothetical protein [Roseateles sp.]|uniref:hypothetical protein n=1 Tax=Roseateles sp. TaxID=1971397 RepID=UPI0037C5C8D7